MHLNTRTHVFLPPHTHTDKPFPPRLGRQTVLNTNHWPVDVSVLLRGIRSVQSLCLNALTHTNSKDKHNQLFKSLVLAHVFFFLLFLLFLFCCFYSILWQPYSQEARRARYEA